MKGELEIKQSVKINNLCITFSRRDGSILNVLDNICFETESGEFLCIVGPSGCGKSTLLNVISKVLKPTSGDITVFGCENSRALLGYVFQDSRLLNWLTVEGNIKFVLESMKVSPALWKERVEYYLDLVGLREFKDEFPLALSGGMQQRVSIARALAIKPDILLMDEPFSNLDELTARAMRRDLLEIWEKEKKLIIFVTHNALEAAFLADRVIILSRRPGRILAEKRVGIPRPRVFEDPRLFDIQRNIVSILEDQLDASKG